MFRGKVILWLNPFAGNLIRTYRSRATTGTAGFKHQNKHLNDIKAFQEDPEVDFEADFNNLSASYDQHERELDLRKEQRKLFVYKSKYFKSKKSPNLLTWAEKEQIRNLYKKSPDEWTAEKLAECFPATEDIIIKVMTSKWTPSDLKSVERHDRSVRRNWDLFKANKLEDLDPELSEHLRKFSDRNFDSSKNAYMQTANDQIAFKFPVPKSTEFTRIITSLEETLATRDRKGISNEAKLQIEASEAKIQEEKIEYEKRQKRIVPAKFNKQLILHDRLNKRIVEDDVENHLGVDMGETKSLIDDDILTNNKQVSNAQSPAKILTENKPDYVSNDESSSETINLTPADVEPFMKIQKYKSKEVSLTKGTGETKSIGVNEFIRIPDRLWKRGRVYKLYDCFYDHKGRFLYRVPGLV